MPEGPEIKLAADELASVLEGQVLQRVFFAFPELNAQKHQLERQTIARVRPRGKAMLIEFANQLTLYSHNQLYGIWKIFSLQTQLADTFQTNRQLRVALVTELGEARLYSASDISILDKQGVQNHKFLKQLGPDVLDDDTDVGVILHRLNNLRFARRSLAGLLLDQHFIAGLGNYLRSEILYELKLHPQQRLQSLSENVKQDLARVILQMTQQSYETRGICVNSEMKKDLQAQRDDYEYYRFAVFGHDNRPCLRCGEPIEKTAEAGRRLYLCPVCQSHLPSS